MALGTYLDAGILHETTPEQAHVRGWRSLLRTELGQMRVVHTTDPVNTRRPAAFTLHPVPDRSGERRLVVSHRSSPPWRWSAPR